MQSAFLSHNHDAADDKDPWKISRFTVCLLLILSAGAALLVPGAIMRMEKVLISIG